MAFLLEDFDERLGEIDLDVLGLVGACILLGLAFAVGAGEKRPDEVLVRLDLLLACRELLACVRRVVDADGACRVLAALVPVGRRLGGVEEESDRVGHCCELMHVLEEVRLVKLGVDHEDRPVQVPLLVHFRLHILTPRQTLVDRLAHDDASVLDRLARRSTLAALCHHGFGFRLLFLLHLVLLLLVLLPRLLQHLLQLFVLAVHFQPRLHLLHRLRVLVQA
mmetsp:Transcript_125500/g.187420  ORF Transcript_125500/g.187420 Transcript_125500/m.187420 type:complete len:222 (-) Transcript_125500:609-1274(-)